MYRACTAYVPFYSGCMKAFKCVNIVEFNALSWMYSHALIVLTLLIFMYLLSKFLCHLVIVTTFEEVKLCELEKRQL